MTDFVDTPPCLRVTLWVVMETMHLHVAKISVFLMTIRLLLIQKYDKVVARRFLVRMTYRLHHRSVNIDVV